MDPKMLRIGINGFGRIGRMVCRLALNRSNLQIVAINSSARPDYLAYQFKHDSCHGIFKGTVDYTETELILNGMVIAIFHERDPAQIKWPAVDYVVEATGQFTSLEQASKHHGVGKVIITGPSADAPMIVMGVNSNQYHPNMAIISNASCTTNCVGPLLKIVDDRFEIEDASITTIHAVTASQKIVDSSSDRDWRAGRSGLNNIIPSSTGAMAAIGKIIPNLAGKITGLAFRVPVVDVSVADLTIRIKSEITTAELHQLIQEATNTIIGSTAAPVVSTDIIGTTHSCVVDLALTYCIHPHLLKIVAWYDNEVGYASRVLDLVQFVATN